MAVQRANITLGTAGHIDHGKTALVKSLTGCDTDRLKEEKERGMSIELGFAPCRIADLEVGIVDVPGHENFVKTMVAGASGMDGVILVVSADDGVMPQTREHLDILTLLGVRHGIVALTKIDRVSKDHLEAKRAETEEFLKGTFLDTAPILPLSNTSGEGFDAFYRALEALVRSIEPKTTDGLFRLPVERAFSVKGYGTVVAGIPASGSARTGDEVVLLPKGLDGHIIGIEVFKRKSAEVIAGQCAALNVRHWDHTVISRGDVVTVPGFFSPQRWYVCTVKLLSGEEPALKNGTPVKFHTGTSEVSAVVFLMTGEAMRPGEDGLAQIRLDHDIVAGPRDRYILRTLAPVRTIGGGIIIEALGYRMKRNRPEVREDIEERARAVTKDEDFVEYCVGKTEKGAATCESISSRAKIPVRRVRSIVEHLEAVGKIIQIRPGSYMRRDTADSAIRRILSVLQEYHRATPESPGMTFDALQTSSGLPRDIAEGLLAILKADGRVEERNRRFAVAGHRATFVEEDRMRMQTIESLYRQRAFAPPSQQEAASAVAADIETVRRLIGMLLDQDRLVRVAEDLLFHRDAIETARDALVAFIRKEGRMDSVKFKYLVGTTRKYAIPLLDYFDRTGLTRSVGHTRYLRPADIRGGGE